MRVAFDKHLSTPVYTNPIMKTCCRLCLAALLFATASLSSNATTWHVNVQSFAFVNSPEIVTVGDTIVWTWIDGSHTTTSNTIPAGAAPWNADITALFPTYTYVVEVPGTYGYHCIPHQGMMNETFVALPAGAPLEVSIVVSNTTVCSLSDCVATADVMVSGGTPPYSFEWTNGSTDEDQTGLCEGLYEVTVTDVNGITASATANVQLQQDTINYACITWTNISTGCGAPFVAEVSTACSAPGITMASIHIWDATSGLVYTTVSGATGQVQIDTAGTYTAELIAVTANGCFDTATAQLTFTEQSCATPGAVNITNTTATSFKVNWTGNDCAVKYRIRVRNMQTNIASVYMVNAPQEFKTIIGLSTNTLYQVRVRTQCSPSDLSAWSAPVYVTTAGGVVSPCVAPANATAEGTPNNTANVSWSSVPNANGYRIRFREVGATAWTPIVIPSGADSTFIITDLAAGTTYEYQIRTKCTVNPNTWSAFSPVATFSTPLRLGESDRATVKVFPNPSNGLVNMNVNDNGTLIVFDAIGREVTRREALNQSTLTLTDLPAGLLTFYFIRSNGLVERGSFVVNR